MPPTIFYKNFVILSLFLYCFYDISPVSGLITGNTYIMKPSERDPTACMALVELLRDAGAPEGTVNVIHGQHDCVNFICDHPDIRAIRYLYI